MAAEKILLLSGAIGAGKTSVANAFLESFCFEKVSSSAYLRSYFTEVGLKNGDEGRLQLQELGDRLDIETDFLWVIDPVTVDAISKNPLISRWLVDAVRKKKQVEHFRTRFRTRVRHVHLTAHEDVLRSRQANRAGDYDKAIAHSNEVSARRLRSIADLVIDTSASQPNSIATEILEQWGIRNA